MHVTAIDKYESVVMRFKDKNCIQNYGSERDTFFLLVIRMTAKIVSTYMHVGEFFIHIYVKQVAIENEGVVGRTRGSIEK